MWPKRMKKKEKRKKEREEGTKITEGRKGIFKKKITPIIRLERKFVKMFQGNLTIIGGEKHYIRICTYLRRPSAKG